MYDCDVLIVGAGPVGTALALELASYGVSFRIVDQSSERSDKSRALGIQPRTMELLSRHIDVGPLEAQAKVGRGGWIFINRKLTAKATFDDLDTPDTDFPLPLIILQGATERFLDEALASHGAAVERPVVATSVSQDAEGATTTLELPGGGQRTIRSRYVVGCDGAHSKVRHAATNLTFEGAAYPQDFLLCDAHITGETTLPKEYFSLCLGIGSLAIIPMKDGVWRLMASGHGISTDETPSLEWFQSFLDRFAPPGAGTLSDPVWISRFRLHHRCVDSYRDGRLFVAGDAAHLHSPVGGQGLNAGIQDGINLGWKLSVVLKGQAADPEALLDSYSTERRRVGEHLINRTDKMFGFVSAPDSLFARFCNIILPWILPLVMRSKARRVGFFRFVSQFGITYRKSPIVGNATDAEGLVVGGSRLPERKLLDAKSDADSSVYGICDFRVHTLLLFAGTGESAGSTSAILREAGDKLSKLAGDGVAVRFLLVDAKLPEEWPDHTYVDVEGKLHAQFGFTKPSYVLVRPDAYIAHVGLVSKLDELLDFWKSIFSTPSASSGQAVAS